MNVHYLTIGKIWQRSILLHKCKVFRFARQMNYFVKSLP